MHTIKQVLPNQFIVKSDTESQMVEVLDLLHINKVRHSPSFPGNPTPKDVYCIALIHLDIRKRSYDNVGLSYALFDTEEYFMHHPVYGNTYSDWYSASDVIKHCSDWVCLHPSQPFEHIS